MADFTVTYVTGQQQVLTADTFRESGSWIVFKIGTRDQVLLSADSVSRVDRTDPIPAAPTKPSRLFRSVCAFALTTIGLVSLVVGLIDLFGAETVSGRAFGAVLAGAGATCIAGAYGVAADRADGLRWALNGAMAATAVPLGLLGLQLAAGGHNPVLTLALMAFALIALVFAIRLSIAGARPRLPTALRGFVAAGIIVGLFQFWYDKEYVPASREAGLTEVVELAASPVPQGRVLPEFVTASVTLKNVSGTKVRVIGSHFALWNFDPGRPEQILVASGSLGFGDGNWLSPGQDSSEKMVFRLPSGPHPGMRLVVTVHLTKGDRLPHGRRVRCSHNDCPVAWRVGESSFVNQLTREPRWVVQLRETSKVRVADSPNEQLRETALTTCVSRHPYTCVGDDELNGLYGRVAITSETELALEEKPAMASPPPSK